MTSIYRAAPMSRKNEERHCAFLPNGSLWVAWTRKYLLKDSLYWDANEKKGSWVWRKLLKLRPIAYDCIRYEIRNGEAVYFWFDNWLEMGKLLDITGMLGIDYLGVSII
ncbi:unnamed protein product, partial [Brassica oleracea var. botrytis]